MTSHLDTLITSNLRQAMYWFILFYLFCACKCILHGAQLSGYEFLKGWEVNDVLYWARRLELEQGKIVVGEFQGFKGRSSEAEILSFAKRSTVRHMVMTHQQSWINTIFGEFLHLDWVHSPSLCAGTETHIYVVHASDYSNSPLSNNIFYACHWSHNLKFTTTHVE